MKVKYLRIPKTSKKDEEGNKKDINDKDVIFVRKKVKLIEKTKQNQIKTEVLKNLQISTNLNMKYNNFITEDGNFNRQLTEGTHRSVKMIENQFDSFRYPHLKLSTKVVI